MPYTGRTMQADQNRRSQRIGIRVTPEERALVDRAVAAAGTSMTVSRSRRRVGCNQRASCARSTRPPRTDAAAVAVHPRVTAGYRPG